MEHDDVDNDALPDIEPAKSVAPAKSTGKRVLREEEHDDDDEPSSDREAAPKKAAPKKPKAAAKAKRAREEEEEEPSEEEEEDDEEDDEEEEESGDEEEEESGGEGESSGGEEEDAKPKKPQPPKKGSSADKPAANGRKAPVGKKLAMSAEPYRATPEEEAGYAARRKAALEAGHAADLDVAKLDLAAEQKGFTERAEEFPKGCTAREALAKRGGKFYVPAYTLAAFERMLAHNPTTEDVVYHYHREGGVDREDAYLPESAKARVDDVDERARRAKELKKAFDAFADPLDLRLLPMTKQQTLKTDAFVSLIGGRPQKRDLISDFRFRVPMRATVAKVQGAEQRAKKKDAGDEAPAAKKKATEGGGGKKKTAAAAGDSVPPAKPKADASKAAEATKRKAPSAAPSSTADDATASEMAAQLLAGIAAAEALAKKGAAASEAASALAAVADLSSTAPGAHSAGTIVEATLEYMLGKPEEPFPADKRKARFDWAARQRATLLDKAAKAPADSVQARESRALYGPLAAALEADGKTKVQELEVFGGLAAPLLASAVEQLLARYVAPRLEVAKADVAASAELHGKRYKELKAGVEALEHQHKQLLASHADETEKLRAAHKALEAELKDAKKALEEAKKAAATATPSKEAAHKKASAAAAPKEAPAAAKDEPAAKKAKKTPEESTPAKKPDAPAPKKAEAPKPTPPPAPKPAPPPPQPAAAAAPSRMEGLEAPPDD